MDACGKEVDFQYVSIFFKMAEPPLSGVIGDFR
jgi:hypothetical protein